MQSNTDSREGSELTAELGRLRGLAYRLVMRFSHRYNWHYAPPIYPEGDTQLWCKWCGFRQTIKRAKQAERPNVG